METDQFLILMSPGIGPAAVRIGKAADTGFVSIVDRRSSMPGQHKGDCFPEDRPGYAFLRRTAPQLSHTSYLMIGSGQETGVIVVGKLIHRHLIGLSIEGRRLILQQVQEKVRIVHKLRMVGVAVLLHSGEIPGHRLHKGVVIHDGIPLVALKPGGSVPVMLRENHCVRIGLFHIFPEILPELVVKFLGPAQIRSYIQPPAVYIVGRRDPFPGDAHNIVIQLLRSLITELGQRVVPPPAVIIFIIRPVVLVVEFKKLPVRAVCGNIGALFVVAVAFVKPFSVQPFVKGAAVVEHAIQEDAHPSLVNFLHKMNEKFVAGFQVLLTDYALHVFGRFGIVQLPRRKNLSAVIFNHCKMGIDVIIILGIVLVVRGRYENRVHVNDLNSQILQVVQFIQNSLQVAAVKAADIHRLGIFVPILHTLHLLANVAVLSGQHIIGGIAVAETVHVNLIHDRALGPLRRGKTRNDTEGITALQIVRHVLLIIEKPFIPGTDLKKVRNQLCSHVYLCLIVIKISFGSDLFHGPAGFSADDIHLIHVVLPCTESQGHSVARLRFQRNPVNAGFVRVKRLLINFSHIFTLSTMLFPVISLYTTPFSITTFFLILKTAQVLFRFSADR